MYPVYTNITQQRLIPSALSYVNASISLKRMSPPTPPGLRKDWPESKAVQKSTAETSNYNKKSVKGEAKVCINSVYITKPEAYDLMWEKLELYYKDTCASVQTALEGLQRL